MSDPSTPPPALDDPPRPGFVKLSASLHVNGETVTWVEHLARPDWERMKTTPGMLEAYERHVRGRLVEGVAERLVVPLVVEEPPRDTLGDALRSALERAGW